MNRFLFLCLFVAGSCFGTTFGTGPTLSCYSDSAYTNSVGCQAMEGQTIYLVSPVAVTWSTYGAFTGTLTTIDSTHAKYVSPSQITPKHVVAGMQVLPEDEVFFTPVDQLPLLSSHWVGDGSNYCETASAYANHASEYCQGDPTQGTGNWMVLEPAGFANAGTNNPGSSSHSGADVYGVFQPSFTSQAAILDSTVPYTYHVRTAPYYGPETDFTGPDPRFKFILHEQAGTWHEGGGGYDCSLTVSNGGPDVPYPNCPQTGTLSASTAPYARPGGDWHLFMEDPATLNTYDYYQWFDKFGYETTCADGTLACGLASAKNLNWHTYSALLGMGLASTPEVPLELTGEDLDRAAYLGTGSILHQLVYPANRFWIEGSGTGATSAHNTAYLWPAQGPTFTGLNDATHTLPVIGARYRLDPKRASIDGAIFTSFALTNNGSGYTPGQVVNVSITSGCSTITGSSSGPSAIIFIGTNGSAYAYGGNTAWITNTGHQCNGPFHYTVDPPGGSGTCSDTTQTPTTGTCIQGTPGFFSGSWKNTNVAAALYSQATSYGFQLDDATTAHPKTMRSDGDASNSPYLGTLQQFYPGLSASPNFSATTGSSSVGQMFGDIFLYNQVDQSSLIPQATGFPASAADANTGMKGYWIADSASSYEGSNVTHQAMVKAVATSGGAISYTPIPLLGVGVVSIFGDQYNHINILSGMPAYQIPWKVYGDPTNAGVTFSWITDPCAGSDSLNSSGLYTACPQYNGTSPKIGLLKITSNANNNAFAIVHLVVLPVDSSGNIRLDVGGSGSTLSGTGCDGSTWAGLYNADSGTDWAFSGSFSVTKTSDYPGWVSTAGNFSTAGAPTASSCELPIYQSYSYPNELNDMSLVVAVPNGNYRMRVMSGNPLYGGKAPGPSNHSMSNIQIGDQVIDWMWCIACQVSNSVSEPSDISGPVQVTDNILRWKASGVMMTRFAGFTPWYAGTPLVAGLSFMKDTTTTPYWEMGSYAPQRIFRGDEFVIDTNDGVHTTPDIRGFSTGFLQLYIRDWYTGKNLQPSTAGGDVVWTLVKGPGSLTSTGLYTAPVNAPTANDCAIVKAQSASTPSLYVQHSVCVVPTVANSEIVGTPNVPGSQGVISIR